MGRRILGLGMGIGLCSWLWIFKFLGRFGPMPFYAGEAALFILWLAIAIEARHFAVRNLNLPPSSLWARIAYTIFFPLLLGCVGSWLPGFAAIVGTSSMLPNLEKGDTVYVDRMSYWFNEPQVGDIVLGTLKSDAESQIVLRRLIAKTGDVVQWTGEDFLVNGRHLALNYPIIRADRDDQLGDSRPTPVPLGQYYGASDNRKDIIYNLIIPLIDREQIDGKVTGILWRSNQRLPEFHATPIGPSERVTPQ